jgi:cytochrome P450
MKDLGELEARFLQLQQSESSAMTDPWPLWRDLRHAGPVVRLGPSFGITSHANVKAVLRDHERFSSNSNRTGTRAERIRKGLDEEQRRAFDEIYDFQGQFVVSTDGDQHERLRRIAHRAFTPRRIAELEASTAVYVDQVLSEIALEPQPDLMELAYRVPLMVIGDLLGVPACDRELIKSWSDRWGRNRGGVEPGPLMDAHAAMREFRAYVEVMIDEHRRSQVHSSGLVSALIDAEQEDRIEAEEIAGMFFVLLFAGHETTTNLIGTGSLELLRRPEQWRALCRDPAVAAIAVEELLRYVTPVQWTQRVAVETIEVAGTEIPAGSTVLTLLASANRDPTVFADPETLDITRSDSRHHVALGFGPHFCLGASLARLEGRIALGILAARHPATELATDTVTVEGNAMLRRLRSLPVRLG